MFSEPSSNLGIPLQDIKHCKVSNQDRHSNQHGGSSSSRSQRANLHTSQQNIDSLNYRTNPASQQTRQNFQPRNNPQLASSAHYTYTDHSNQSTDGTHISDNDNFSQNQENDQFSKDQGTENFSQHQGNDDFSQHQGFQLPRISQIMNSGSLGSGEHRLVYTEGLKHKLCEFCQINKVKTKKGWYVYTTSKCQACDVPLCKLGQRNCFFEYHRYMGFLEEKITKS